MHVGTVEISELISRKKNEKKKKNRFQPRFEGCRGRVDFKGSWQIIPEDRS